MEITKEMRGKLREPLPSEAVSQHPTKSFMSSIKSIYVAERINDVFGVGSWTLKSQVTERVDYKREDKNKVLRDVRFVVVKAFLEIPSVGFYGEAYGGNDNEDIGDAYKGAVTDAFTKIAGQQLEIGIDIFKGISTVGKAVQDKVVQPQEKSEHWCVEHDTEFYMRGKMKNYGHKIEGTDKWCNEPESIESKSEPLKEESNSMDLVWLKDSLTTLQNVGLKAWSNANVLSYLNAMVGKESKSISEAVSKLSDNQVEIFKARVQEAALDMA